MCILIYINGVYLDKKPKLTLDGKSKIIDVGELKISDIKKGEEVPKEITPKLSANLEIRPHEFNPITLPPEAVDELLARDSNPAVQKLLKGELLQRSTLSSETEKSADTPKLEIPKKPTFQTRKR